jgi:hypothetical protein
VQAVKITPHINNRLSCKKEKKKFIALDAFKVSVSTMNTVLKPDIEVPCNIKFFDRRAIQRF